MAYTLTSFWEGNTDTVGTQSVITRAYLVVVTGTDPSNETAVLTAVANQTQEWFSLYGRTFYRSEVTVEGIIKSDMWRAKVVWSTREKDKPIIEDSAPEISMSTGGGTQHITQSLLTLSRTPTNAVNYDKAIGFDGKTVNGVDIIIPQIEFSEKYTRSSSFLTSEVIKDLGLTAGRVISSAFRGFASGEVLYKGCDISKPSDGSEKAIFTYHFAVSPNRTDIDIGNGITVPSKGGWDYLWIKYADSLDSGSKELIKKPIAAYVEQVYDWVSMQQLYLIDEDDWTHPEAGNPP